MRLIYDQIRARRYLGLIKCIIYFSKIVLECYSIDKRPIVQNDAIDNRADSIVDILTVIWDSQMNPGKIHI